MLLAKAGQSEVHSAFTFLCSSRVSPGGQGVIPFQ